MLTNKLGQIAITKDKDNTYYYYACEFQFVGGQIFRISDEDGSMDSDPDNCILIEDLASGMDLEFISDELADLFLREADCYDRKAIGEIRSYKARKWFKDQLKKEDR